MKKIIPAYLRVLIVFFAVAAAMEYIIDSGDQPAFLKFTMVSIFLLIFLFLLIAIEMTINAVDRVTYQLLTEEQKAAIDETENISLTENAWFKKIITALTKTESDDKAEAQLLLQHDYDGIKELDNNLPPWWVYLFYLCILFSIVYMVRFQIMGGDDQETELKNELAQAKIEIEEYNRTAPDLMDEKTVTLLDDAESLSAGKAIYTANCVACHRADGGGQIGPNLTDEYWILGGGIKNVFRTLVNGGRDGKGMISWKGTLKPKEMQKVASYVLSLKGTNPKDAKAAAGEIWIDKDATTSDQVMKDANNKTVMK